MRRIAIIHAPDRVREVCAQWQSSGAIGSAFAAVASGHIVTVAEFERDIWLTKLDSDSAYNDMRLLEDFVRQLQARYSLHIQGVSHGNIHYACLSIAHCVDVYRNVSDDFAYYGVTIGHGSISRYDARDCDDESHNDIERILSIGPRGGVRMDRV